MVNRLRHIYEFGPYLLDETERILHKNGQEIDLTAKSFDVLLVLVRNSGHIVEKETFMSEVWQGSFVEEANITQNVSVLKKVFRENDISHRYIETIPKRGYRFTARVKELWENGSLVATRTQAPDGSIPTYTDTNNAANTGRWMLVLSATISDIDKPIAEALEAHLKRITSDVNLTLLRIEEGSLILTLEGTRLGYERINESVESGQLYKVFGFGIIFLFWLGSEKAALEQEIKNLMHDFVDLPGVFSEGPLLLSRPDGAAMYVDPHSDLELIQLAYSGNRRSAFAVSDRAKIGKRKRNCLEKCLASLSLENQQLVFAYYFGATSEFIGSESLVSFRKELAAQLGIAPSSLRARIHRIKRRFERCVSDCTELSSKRHRKQTA